jgi:MFS family permease
MTLANYLKHRAQGIFFGWWIVGGAVGIEFLLSVLLLQAYGTYAAIWREEFGWSATALALAYSLHRAETGLLGPIQGWLLEHFGAKTVMRVGVVLLSVGFMLLSQINSLLTFYLTFALMALGGSLMGILSLMTVLVNWFEKKRATALALMQTGMSLGGLAAPIVAWALLTYGWRSVSFASGLIMLLFGLPLVQLMRDRPETYGTHPDGIPPTEEKSRLASQYDAPPSVAPRHQDFTPRQALKTRAFWFLSLGHALAVTVVSAVLVHLVVHLNEELGYSIQSAALLFAVMTGFTVAGQLMGGVIGDRLNKRLIVTAAMFGHASALLALAFGDSLPWVLYFAAAHGLAWGLRGPLMGALRADYFGRKSFPTIMGISSVIVMFGSMSGPILAGVLVDLLGNYRLAFLILSGLAAMGSVFFLFATRPRPTYNF